MCYDSGMCVRTNLNNLLDSGSGAQNVPKVRVIYMQLFNYTLYFRKQGIEANRNQHCRGKLRITRKIFYTGTWGGITKHLQWAQS